MKLVWSDEFDTPGLPDPAKWDYEVGFVRNNELQYYTRARQANARVEGGNLVIEGIKEHYAIPAADGGRKGGQAADGFAEYTAAALITKGKESWTYGRIEVRAKLPQGKGVWPAIWMLGTNIPQIGWPACGEIDIMEFVGHTPDKVHATCHFGKGGKHTQKGGNITTAKPWEDFHVYAVEWTADAMDFYFDKDKYFTFPLDTAADRGVNPFRKPQYLLINLALGGSWGGNMDDSVLPQKFLVDYVRVYQKAEK
jgi:beta-glucanase (GH16 family)